MSPNIRQSVFVHVYIIRHPTIIAGYKATIAELGSCWGCGVTETEAEVNAIQSFRDVTNLYIQEGRNIPWRERKSAPGDATVRTVRLLLGPASDARWYDLALGGLLWLGGWCLVHGIHLIDRIGGWIEDRIRGKKGK